MEPRCGHAEPCTCGGVNIPIPIPAPEPEETVTTCENCGESGDNCSCIRCSACEEVVDQICSRCDICTDCCNDCQTCENCERRLSNDRFACSNCGDCDSCCDCYTCAECDSRVHSDNYCGVCEHCDSCCTCGQEMELLEATSVFHTANLKQHTVIKSKRHLAVEIEVDGCNYDYQDRIHFICKKYGAGIVHDGSLSEAGFEIPTSPASGDLFAEQINDICGVLQKAGAKVTRACGLHIHVDCRDFGWWEVQRLIKLYAKIEDALFSVVPPSRRENHYCQRCGDVLLNGITHFRQFSPKKMKTAVMKTLYGEDDLKGVREEKYKSVRYFALNIHTWLMRGTIECRLFGGTVDPVKIINWGKLWSNIIDWVYKHSDKDIEKFKDMYSWEVLLSLCPDSEVAAWLTERRKKCKVSNSRED